MTIDYYFIFNTLFSYADYRSYSKNYGYQRLCYTATTVVETTMNSYRRILSHVTLACRLCELTILIPLDGSTGSSWNNLRSVTEPMIMSQLPWMLFLKQLKIWRYKKKLQKTWNLQVSCVIVQCFLTKTITDFLKKFCCTFSPRLNTILQHYMIISPTSSASERRFSTSGQCISKKRSRIKPIHAERQLFLLDNASLKYPKIHGPDVAPVIHRTLPVQSINEHELGVQVEEE